MNIQSIVRFANANGKGVGLGTVVSQRRVVTMGYVIQEALGLSPENDLMPTDPVSFQMPFSSSRAMISSRVIGWAPTLPGASMSIAVLEVPSESENFLSPAPLISARDTNFFFRPTIQDVDSKFDWCRRPVYQRDARRRTSKWTRSVAT